MILALILTMAVAQAAPTGAPAAPATPMAPVTPSPADLAATARAKDWLHQIQAGKIDRSQLTDKMNAAITDSLLAQVSAQLAPLGEPSAFTLTQRTTQNGYAAYVFKLQFAKGTIIETLVLDPAGKIAGLSFRPSQ